jgi:ubiquinol oxidase
VLHLRETFGERYEGMSERMRTHYAEADNELHHLLIMEELGGNANVIDRIIAQTAAFVYYWYIVLIYSMSEPAAYHLSELIEDHAYNTYNTVRNC